MLPITATEYCTEIKICIHWLSVKGARKRPPPQFYLSTRVGHVLPLKIFLIVQYEKQILLSVGFELTIFCIRGKRLQSAFAEKILPKYFNVVQSLTRSFCGLAGKRLPQMQEVVGSNQNSSQVFISKGEGKLDAILNHKLLQNY